MMPLRAPVWPALVITLCNALIAPFAQGQIRPHKNVICGTVLETETRFPVVNVNVFLSNTKIGTGTDTQGSFSLDGIPSGRYDVVFSCVGYERVIQSVLLDRDTTVTINVRLKPRAIIIPGVEVLGESRSAWERQRNMRMFLEEFLGKTNNAAKCKVLNQDVIHLSWDTTEILTASSDSAIIVENRALGYRLSVELIGFTFNAKLKGVKLFYYPRFEDLVPIDSQEVRRWRANREKSYLGSRRHFFRSLFHRSLAKDGFQVTSGTGLDIYNRPGYPVTDSLHIGFSPDSLTCWLDLEAAFLSREYLRIDFQSGYARSRLDDYNSSIFEARQPRILIVLGELDDPRSIAVYGRWARDRIAEEVPLEYVARER